MKRIPFENRMTRTERILGWIYLPLHMVVLPLLLGLFRLTNPEQVSQITVNLIYFGTGTVFVVCAMFRFLRGNFDVLLDRPGRCLLSLLLAALALYGLNFLAGLIVLLFGDMGENPNNAAVLELAGTDYGAVRALAVFLAPVVEEPLFRGVAFGGIRTRSRVWAYIVSALLFGLYHTWQYALACADPLLLAQIVLYIPFSVASAWCYERGGSIWTCIFFHMGYNALAFYLLEMVY